MLASDTSIYLAPYHSNAGAYLRGSTGRFRIVEEAIATGGWPYDNGDDPSFYAARHDGLLTWGVCRQDVRNAVKRESVVVFFSYTQRGHKVLYRMSAVATVSCTLDRRKVFADSRFDPRDYLNILIRPEKSGWRYDETDRRKSARHKDWLWRIAVHGRRKEPFAREYERIYRDGWFTNKQLSIAQNYVVFSELADKTYISPNPPVVATAVAGEHEQWSDHALKGLTVGTAAAYLRNGRNYLRTTNRSGQNVHPKIRFDMSTGDAVVWRQRVIAALKRGSERRRPR